MLRPTLERFDIRNFAERLISKQGKSRYQCPVCEDGTLTIDPKTGAYHCWEGDGCPSELIREAVNPLSEALARIGIEKKDFVPKKRIPKQKPVITPATIPDGVIQLGVLPQSVTEETRTRVGSTIEIKYPYSATQWVKRTEYPNGKKITLPYHTNSNGETVNKKGDQEWPSYRFDEIVKYGAGNWILGVEGEKVTDISRSIFGFLTTTFQGGSWSQEALDKYFQAFKDAGVIGFVYDPDHDKTGYAKAEKCKLAAAKACLPFIALDPIRLWADCPDGGDIADWVKAGVATSEALHQEINRVADELRGSPQKKEPSTDWKDQVLAEQKKLHTLTYKPDFVPNPNKKYLPNNLVDIIPHIGIVLLGGPKGAGKSVFIDRTKDKLCGGYWEEKILPSQLSLTGENKPEIERIYHEKTGIRFISITARIALGRGQAVEWDITWIEDGDLTKSDQFDYEGELVQTATFLETADGIGLCWDSLAKLFDRDWSNSIVVIDEIELGLSHVATSSTCKDRRSKILSTLETKLKECLDGNGLVIGADADLTDITYDYLTAICPGHKPFIVKHNYIRPDADKWDIDFYSGKKDEVISLIENCLSDKDCEPITVSTDNQTEAEGLANHLIKKYPWLANTYNGLIRIDSTITKTDFGKDFVKRPNEKIQEYQPKILIYTPSMGVGCSLDIPYFKYVFSLFFGNQEPSQSRQMMARVRQPVPRIVWAADRGQGVSSDDFNSFLPSAIKKQVFSHNDLTTQVIDLALNMAKQQTESNDDADILPKLIEQLTKMMGSNGTWDNPHIDLFCKLKARRNFALSQFALQLRQELLDEGHNINDYAAEEKTDAGDRVKGEKLEIKMNRATKTANAVDIELQQAKEINRKPNPTDEEQYQANKAFLKDELPGIDLSSDFIFKAVHKDNRRWLNSIKFYWMINNIDATKEADRRHWRYKLKQFCDGVSYLPDIRTFSGKVEAINKINLFDAVPLDDFETEYFNDDEDLKLWFKNSVIPHKKLLKNAFNLTVKKDTEIVGFINRLLGKIGLKLKQSRKEGNIKYYCLDAELALDEDRFNVLKALDLRRELQLKVEAEAR